MTPIHTTNTPASGADAELGAARTMTVTELDQAFARHRRELLGSYTDAEDMVQETLVRAWRHQSDFEAGTNLRAWLYRIATNVCIDRER